MKFQHIVGTDLSKRTIDLFCQLRASHMIIDNDISGYKRMVRWLKEQKINCSEVMIVMEHTGPQNKRRTLVRLSVLSV
jgi:hypothetical protein